MISIPPTTAEIHILACHFITRLSRCRPHPLRVFYQAGEPPKILTRRRLPGERMAIADPVDGVLVGVYKYPTGFAAFKADLRATIATGQPPAPPPANPRKLTPDGFPTEAVNDFCSYLLKAKQIAAYWSPSLGRATFRAARLVGDRRPAALPADAALVGNFTHPCPRDVFAEALRETINEHKSQQVAA